jgi:hypothetical protein
MLHIFLDLTEVIRETLLVFDRGFLVSFSGYFVGLLLLLEAVGGILVL